MPYPILVFCGMLPWQFFATAFAESGNSLVSNAGMISKVYFPRLVVPVSSVITSFVDFLISAVMMAIMMVYYGYAPGPSMLLLPLVHAAGLRHRIRRRTVGLRADGALPGLPLHRALRRPVRPLYLSGRFQQQRGAGAVALALFAQSDGGVIDGFRWAILGEQTLYWPGFWISVAGVVLIIISGIWYFRRTERTFADVI